MTNPSISGRAAIVGLGATEFSKNSGRTELRTDAATALAEVEKVTTALLPVPTGEVVELEAAAPDQAAIEAAASRAETKGVTTGDLSVQVDQARQAAADRIAH